MYGFVKEKSENTHISSCEVLEIENKYNINFPTMLKEYYLQHNGDKIRLCIFTVDEEEFGVAKIVELKYGNCSFEKIVKNVYSNEDLYTFSAGRILYAGRKTDILHGFIDSKIGKLTFEKLGIDKKEVKFFYNSQKITPKEEAPFIEKGVLKVRDLAMYIYFKKPDFVEFLSHRGITEKRFFKLYLW